MKIELQEIIVLSRIGDCADPCFYTALHQHGPAFGQD